MVHRKDKTYLPVQKAFLKNIYFKESPGGTNEYIPKKGARLPLFLILYGCQGCVTIKLGKILIP